jgi:type IV secretory pathway VirB10-like protein
MSDEDEFDENVAAAAESFSDEEMPETPPDETDEYQTTPESATSFTNAQPGFFNRKKVLVTIMVTFALIIGGGILMNINSGSKEKNPEALNGTAAAQPPDFLRRQRDDALAAGQNTDTMLPPIEEIEEAGLPPIRWSDTATERVPPPPPPPPQPRGGGGGAAPTHYASSLMPRIEGRFNTDAPPVQQKQAQSSFPIQAARQQVVTTQANQETADSSSQAGNGWYIQDNTLWIGTVIPGVLTTAINTDLPGNILARVSENVYDSKTGKNLLIPQGSILFARYNSSISYAQKRVQIAWDTLIRPDGYQLDLGGMGGIDKRGMAGQEAEYHENWFEYMKAAGLIAVFSIANAKMAEQAEKQNSELVAGGIAQANAEFLSQTSNSIVSRVMNIQPTLTVDSGTGINIMINQNIALPPLPAFNATQRYQRN